MRIATRLDADTSIVTCAKLLYFTTRVTIYIETVKTMIYEKGLINSCAATQQESPPKTPNSNIQ